jgi:hypothetical protein
LQNTGVDLQIQILTISSQFFLKLQPRDRILTSFIHEDPC